MENSRKLKGEKMYEDEEWWRYEQDLLYGGRNNDSIVKRWMMENVVYHLSEKYEPHIVSAKFLQWLFFLG